MVTYFQSYFLRYLVVGTTRRNQSRQFDGSVWFWSGTTHATQCVHMVQHKKKQNNLGLCKLHFYRSSTLSSFLSNTRLIRKKVAITSGLNKRTPDFSFKRS